MKKIGILYSKSTAYTAELGQHIAQLWGEGIEYVDIDTARLEDVLRYDGLILGTPTYFNGELPSVWDEFLPELEGEDLSGKKVAIYGTGNEVASPVSFADGVGLLAEYFTELGATIIGRTSTAGYTYEQSIAESEGSFLGLIIDWVNHPNLTDKRLKDWVKQIKKEFAAK